MFTQYMFLFGVAVGIVTTLLIQDLHRFNQRYKDRQQAQFEAAVRDETNRRALASGRYDSWQHVNQASNVNLVDDDDPYRDL
jgi:C4-dicarboxylate transporter